VDRHTHTHTCSLHFFATAPMGKLITKVGCHACEIITLPVIDGQRIVISISVCLSLSVCLLEYLKSTPRFHKFPVHVTYGRGLILL